jgi:hypothetical protein
MAIMTRNIQPLSDDQLARVAPSVFATTAWEEVSDKYTFIPTSTIVERLRAEGLVPVQARQSNTLIEGKRGFAKHEIRFVDHSLLESPDRIVDQTFPMAVLTNSHDRAAAFAIDAGLFRMVCANGMALPDSLCQSVRVRHSGDVGEIIDGVFEVVEQANQLPALVDEYRSLQMPMEAQRAFATAALELRDSNLPITESQLLHPRRSEDANSWMVPKRDLWTTLNVVQENLVKGGLRSRSKTGRRASTRAIKDIAADQKLNKALFVLAEQMADHLRVH